MTDRGGRISIPSESSDLSGELHRFQRNAMGTTFEVVVPGPDAQSAREAAQAALEKLSELERDLGRLIPLGEAAEPRPLAVGEDVPLGVVGLACVRLAQQIYAETDQAFDVTVGALMQCWRKPDGSPREPGAEELTRALERTGMELLPVNVARRTLSSTAEGVIVDLGGIKEGCALDVAGGMLEHLRVSSALIRAGAGSVLGIGAPEGSDGWAVELRHPAAAEPLPRIRLRDLALGCSGVSSPGRLIIDPRTGKPAEGKLAAWAAAPSAAEADALATAFMVMSPRHVEAYCRGHPDVAAVLVLVGGQPLRFGRWGE